MTPSILPSVQLTTPYSTANRIDRTSEDRGRFSERCPCSLLSVIHGVALSVLHSVPSVDAQRDRRTHQRRGNRAVYLCQGGRSSGIGRSISFFSLGFGKLIHPGDCPACGCQGGAERLGQWVNGVRCLGLAWRPFRCIRAEVLQQLLKHATVCPALA